MLFIFLLFLLCIATSVNNRVGDDLLEERKQMKKYEITIPMNKTNETTKKNEQRTVRNGGGRNGGGSGGGGGEGDRKATTTRNKKKEEKEEKIEKTEKQVENNKTIDV